MDYAGEELKRQRLVLTALLMGGGGPEQQEDQREKTQGLPREELAGDALDVREGAAVWENVRQWTNFGFGGRARRSSVGNGTVWRTGPFGEVEEAAGGGDRLLEEETAASREDEGTGVLPAGGGTLEPVQHADLTAEAAVLTRLAAAERSADAENAALRQKPQAAKPVRTEAETRAPGEIPRAREQRTAWELPGASTDGWLSYAAGTAASQEGEARTASGFARQAEAAEARALSLAFQRDARRYDGGFVIY